MNKKLKNSAFIFLLLIISSNALGQTNTYKREKALAYLQLNGNVLWGTQLVLLNIAVDNQGFYKLEQFISGKEEIITVTLGDGNIIHVLHSGRVSIEQMKEYIFSTMQTEFVLGESRELSAEDIIELTK